ncbi:hypothetical protein SAMN04490243_2312 [Robiginitalea myxolifaciens]|uniref:Transposase n=1 Tax=Robiginitalea myxolifaciens TaxID=400055 RepID=A0A1I6H5X8_9FLAO|nr:hypothetical protein [Robiginitalea myxolifaciens]SFR49875.1 hypothetical protein SAMN04490243_2312 [Robiginitalea myxolifaciens]
MAVQTKTTEKVQIVKGGFTPSEASDLLLSLLDEKINFHKLQRLRWCEGYFKADTSYADTRIAQLQEEKDKVREFIRLARKEGKCLTIDGVLNLSFEDQNAGK